MASSESPARHRDRRIVSAYCHLAVVPGLKTSPHTTYTGAQTTYTGSQTTHTGSQTTHTGSQTTHTGSQTTYTGSQTTYTRTHNYRKRVPYYLQGMYPNIRLLIAPIFTENIDLFITWDFTYTVLTLGSLVITYTILPRRWLLPTELLNQE